MHTAHGALRAFLSTIFFSASLVGAASACGGAAPKYGRAGSPQESTQANYGGYDDYSEGDGNMEMEADYDERAYDDDGDDVGGVAGSFDGYAPAAAPRGDRRVAQKDAPGPAPQTPPVPPVDKKGESPTTPPVTTPTAGQGKIATGKKGADRPKPLLIYTANLHLAVFEATKAIDAIEKLAMERDGYLVRRTDTSITVRVPAETFHESLELVSGVGDELHRDVSVSDVTAEFRDLETQLKNLVAVRNRLEKLLDKANSVPAALQVEREVTRVTGEIERIKGRLKLLGELVAFSTITVSFQAQPVESISSTVELPFPWLERLGLPNLLSL